MENKKNILVTGADGQMGHQFRELARLHPELHFTFTDKRNLLITDPVIVEAFFSTHQFDYSINCAAYTAVDKAETEMDIAFDVNGIAVGNLAMNCKKHNTVFIHISTDYVFDGRNTDGYLETDQTNPINVYGASKLMGETLALEKNPESVIIRTSWVYGNYGKNFVKSMLKLMHEKERIGVVNDQFGCPTYTADLADAILQIIKGYQHPEPGIYHYCNAGSTTWFEFAAAIKLIAHLDCIVDPINTSDYPTAARRPQNSVLNTSKIQHSFGLTIPGWKDSLQKCISLMHS